MKSNPKLIDALNALLADELTAIAQYSVHSEINSVRGYDKLHHCLKKRYKEEERHREDLIERIIFLEGTPIVKNLNEIKLSDNVPGQFENDASLEYDSIKSYNNAIDLAEELGDQTTADFLAEILEDEEDHLKKIEAFQGQIKDMGIENFLSTMT